MIPLIERAHSALLIVDMQNDFLSPEGRCAKRHLDISALRKIIPNLVKVLSAFRTSGCTIIFTALVHDSDGTDSPQFIHRILPGSYHRNESPFLVKGTFGAGIIEELRPREKEIVVEKRRFSAFHGTNLDEMLHAKGITTLVISGVLSNVCVFMTAVDAFQHDCDVIILRDCVGSWNKSLQTSFIQGMSQIAGAVRNSASIITMLPRQGE